MKKKVLIIGAGLSGLVLARLFKDNGDDVEIIEKNHYIGGLCADFKFGYYQVSYFGPHIPHFRKETQEALEFIKKYTKLIPFKHKVICLGNSNFTCWPPNQNSKKLFSLINAKDKSLKSEFVDSYSKKVWGKDYPKLKGVINSRFKFKDNYNEEFFENEEAFIPTDGYRTLFYNLAQGMVIKKHTIENIDSIYAKLDDYDYVFVSAPIDEFFKFKFGKLEYKNIQFNLHTIENDGSNLLLTPVMNLNTHSKIIRITEYPQFYESISKQRILGTERVSKYGTPCYPVLTPKNLKILEKYKKYSQHFDNLYFIGRMGEYKYKNMDDCIQDSINLFKKLKGGSKNGR
jgi:UDP-galactopyranose mutase